MKKKGVIIPFLLIATVSLSARTFKEEGRFFPLEMPFRNPAPVVKEVLKNNVQIPDSILDSKLVKLILPRGDGDETEVGPDYDGPQYGTTDRECSGGQMLAGRTYADLDEVESRLAFMTKELRSNLSLSDAPEGAYCTGANGSTFWVGLNQTTLLELRKDGTIEWHQYIPPKPE